MKKQATKLTMVLGVLAAFTAVSRAESLTNAAVKATVPFDFVAGNKVVPAGVYTIERHGSQSVILVRGVQNGQQLALLANSVQAKKVPANASLIFNRYGEKYFLSQVWTTGDQYGRQLNKTRQERELMAQSKPETVILAALR